LTEIREENVLIRGPQIVRNILGIIVVERLPNTLIGKYPTPAVNWYNNLKNFVEILIKSEDGKYAFEV
jgi:hypothetical protein